MEELLNKYYSLKTDQTVVIGITKNGKRTISYLTHNGEHKDVSNSIFEIGSVSKVFTTTLLSHFVSIGKIDLFEPIKTYIPDMKDSNINFFQLATHTSGLPREGKNLKISWKTRENPYEFYTIEHVNNFIKEFKNKKSPSLQPRYSNVGIGILGNLLGVINHSSYEDAVKEHILLPLGLENTFIQFPENLHLNEIKAPVGNGEFYPRIKLPGINGAGAWKSTVNDMLLFLEANMNTENPLYPSLSFAHIPQSIKPMTKDVQMALGWMISPYTSEKKEIVWHGGTTVGFNTHIGFSKKEQLGIVVFDNIHISILEVLKLLLLRKTTKVEQLSDILYGDNFSI